MGGGGCRLTYLLILTCSISCHPSNGSVLTGLALPIRPAGLECQVERSRQQLTAANRLSLSIGFGTK